jgi:2-amino-4-hydroxy-6-hydroxymethyldihydropteridine diphosphokinase
MGLNKAQRWKKAYIGLGANAGNRTENCIKALESLANYPQVKVLRCSCWYETEPVDLNTSQWFINAVAETITTFSSEHLLSRLLIIEESMGRDRIKTEDRPIDMDLLFMEGVFIRPSNLQITQSKSQQIQVPHPRLFSRRFVLAPWAELAPHLVVAPWNKTVLELLSELPEDGQKIRKLVHKETERCRL